MTGLLVASERLQSMLPRFIVDKPRGTTYGEGGLLTVLWMVPGGTNYSAVDSPGGLLWGGTTYIMTDPIPSLVPRPAPYPPHS